MKISLFFPPPAELTQPYLAIPALVGYLRAHGFDDVEQRDLGLDTFDALSSPDNLRRIHAQVCEELEWLDARPALGPEEVLRYDALARAAATGAGLADEIEPAKEFFRRHLTDEAIDQYRWHADRVFAAFRLLSAACYPTEWTEHHFTMRRSRRLPGPVLIEHARDQHQNPFVDYMRRLAPGILASDPRIVGISVAFGTQLIPALTLAAALRDAGCGAHIVVGGAFISHCAPRIPATPQLFDLADSFVTFSGEIPLLRLAEALRDDKPLSTVPGLIYRDGSAIRSVPRAEPPPLEELAPPDFRGLDLGRYFSPRPILPVLTSRGCYFDRCTFCSHTFSYDGRYQRHALDHVIGDIRALQARHAAADFYFVDECLSPSFVRLIANRLLEERLDIRWVADVRYESTFRRELLELAYRSGCRMLAFGLESINQRVVDLMDKGTTRATTERILTDCHEIGIASNVMFFIGFPSETKEEARETLDFVLTHRAKVDMVSMGTFQYNKNAKMHLVADKIGLKVRRPNARHELTDYYRYTAASGMTEMEASLLEDEFLRTFRNEGYDYPLMSRTHALMVKRGLYGFRNGHGAGLAAGADARPVPGEPFTIVRRHYRVADVRAAAKAAVDHLRERALGHLEEADEALPRLTLTVQPRPTWVVAGRSMRDWAIDVTEADVELLERLDRLVSVRTLGGERGGLAKVWRLFHLEQLGAVRFVPVDALEEVPT
jgi:anaerobic magnesium-protoporphyrin IX monomethyl ester cyclase